MRDRKCAVGELFSDGELFFFFLCRNLRASSVTSIEAV
jgi:hypothetical protein